MYNVEGRDEDGNYNEVQKRYNEFLDLRRTLFALQPSVAQIPFPKKTILTKDRDGTKDNRRMLFDKFIAAMLLDAVCRPEVERWLGDLTHEGAKMFVQTSTIRRAFIDRRVEFIPPNDYDRIFELMKSPTPMLKFSGRGEPHWRIFALSGDMSELNYEGSRKAKGEGTPLRIQSLANVILGQEKFRQYRTSRSYLSNVSFTIIGTDRMGRDRQLNLVCRHPHELRFWYLGLMELKRREEEKSGHSRREDRGSFGLFGASPNNLRSPTRERLDSDGFTSDAYESDAEELSPRKSRDELSPRDSRQILSASEDEGDSDKGDEGDRYIWVTSETTLYTWGSNSWGQLGQVASPEPESATKAFPQPTMLNLANQRGQSDGYPHPPPAYIRSVCCGGDCTVVVNGFPRRAAQVAEAAAPSPILTRTLSGSLQVSTSSPTSGGSDEAESVVKKIEPLAWTCGRALLASPVTHESWSILRNVSHNLKPMPMIGLPKGLDVVMVACGDSHMLVLLSCGSVYASGSNIYGQLGIGTKKEGFALQPVNVFGPDGAKIRALSIAAGSTFSAAVAEKDYWHEGSSFDVDNDDGEDESDDEENDFEDYFENKPRLLYTWGDGTYGVLGHGDEESRIEPCLVETFNYTQLSALKKLRKSAAAADQSYLDARLRALSRGATLQEVACGGMHVALLVQDSPVHNRSNASLAIGQDNKNTIWTWGQGMIGQLGHGDKENRLSPQPVEALAERTIRQIACGAAHTVAIIDADSSNRTQVPRGRVSVWGAAIPCTGIATDGSPHIPKLSPEYLHFTKSNNRRTNVAEQIACGDNFTAILDADGNITVLGISPVSHQAVHVSFHFLVLVAIFRPSSLSTRGSYKSQNRSTYTRTCRISGTVEAASCSESIGLQ